MKSSINKGFILITSILSFCFVLSVFLFLLVSNNEANAIEKLPGKLPVEMSQEPLEGGIVPGDETLPQKYAVILLDKMTIALHDGENTVTLPIISIGKPGSYYETPGGRYISDYKMLLHFSSIGHVYMPNSVHIFGNFFIHGIPYYPDGRIVSSDYSGGCIRLSNDDSKAVYDFVEKGTPIIITESSLPSSSRTLISASDMTKLMVATISLEFLNQDSVVYFKGKKTTRRSLIRTLFQGDTDVADFLAKPLGETTYVDYMNKKAKAIGLENTSFGDLMGDATTTEQDSEIFYNYLLAYKPFLFSSTTLR